MQVVGGPWYTELAALLQTIRLRSRSFTSHCSHTTSILEESFGLINKGCDRVSAFGESSLIAVEVTIVTVCAIKRAYSVNRIFSESDLIAVGGPNATSGYPSVTQRLSFVQGPTGPER
jgi:hypothetical protein